MARFMSEAIGAQRVLVVIVTFWATKPFVILYATACAGPIWSFAKTEFRRSSQGQTRCDPSARLAALALSIMALMR